MVKYPSERIGPSEVVGLRHSVQSEQVLSINPNLEVWAGIQAAMVVEEVEPTHGPMGRMNLEGWSHA